MTAKKAYRKSGSISLRIEGKSAKVDLYPAEQWEERDGAEKGRFRLSVNGRWVQTNGHWTFFTFPAAMSWISRYAAGEFSLPEEDTLPDVPRGTRIRFNDPITEMPRMAPSMTLPFRGVDGRPYVFVAGAKWPVALDEARI